MRDEMPNANVIDLVKEGRDRDLYYMVLNNKLSSVDR